LGDKKPGLAGCRCMGNQPRKQCFFITPIGKIDSPERVRSDELLHVLRPVLDQLGYDLTRGDEDPTPGQIMSQVLESIARADVLIADVSGSNPNVYYELAVAHASRRPTVIIQEGSGELPFDIADMRAIPYDLTRPTTTSAMAEAVRRAVDAAQSGDRPRDPLRDLTFGEVEAQELEAVRAVPEAAALADLTEEVRAMGSELKRLRNDTMHRTVQTGAAAVADDLGRDTYNPRVRQASVQAFEVHFDEQETKALKTQLVQKMTGDWLWDVARFTTSRELWDAVAERIRGEHEMEPPAFRG
jgi:hypothetical protein